MSSSGGFLDILNPFTWNAKRRLTGTDDAFSDVLRQYPELYKELFSGTKILCCPVSGSLIVDEITQELLMSHILIPQRSGGEYRTMRGEHVYFSGTELICGAGFAEAREVKVITTSSLSDPSSNKSAMIYRIARPLVGGIGGAPEDSDEVNLQTMFKYMVVLRSFPEVESAFVVLDDYIKEINFVGSKSADGFSRIQPSLAASLQLQWQRATDKLARTNALCTAIGSGPEATKRLIGQVIESYLMHAVSATVYPWVNARRAKQDKVVYDFIESLKHHTMSDLGIAPELQCTQTEAIKELLQLKTAETPVDKLLVLKRAVRHIRSRIDKNVHRKFANEDVELATDDVVLLVIWCLIQLAGVYQGFMTDLTFASKYHFNASSKSELGFTLCHFLVALDWFRSHAEVFRREKRRLRLSRPAEKPNSALAPAVPDSGGAGAANDDDEEEETGTVNETVKTEKSDQSDEKPGRNDGSERIAPGGASLVGAGGAGSSHAAMVAVAGAAADSTMDSPLQFKPISISALQKDKSKSASSNGTGNGNGAPSSSGKRHDGDGRAEGDDGEPAQLSPPSCCLGALRIIDWVRKVKQTMVLAQCQRADAGAGAPGGSTSSSSSGSSSGGNGVGPGLDEDDEVASLAFAHLGPFRSPSPGHTASRPLAATPVSSPAPHPSQYSAHASGAGTDGAKPPWRPGQDVGKTVVVLGRDDRLFPEGVPRRVTITSESTNKAGGILSVTGNDGAFAAVNVDGYCFTWGAPNCGRLGRGPAAELDTFTPTAHPMRVDEIGEGVTVKDVACGRTHMVAVLSDGSLFAWGDNRCAQLGFTSSSGGSGANAGGATPALIPSLSLSLRPISSNATPGGGGGGGSGGGGAGSQAPTYTTPSSDTALANITQPLSGVFSSTPAPQAHPAAAPSQHNGELNAVMSCGPSPLDTLRHVRAEAVACGAHHTLCLSEAGDVYSWGRGSNGRLGQFSDKLTIPDHAVGRPALVRCAWEARAHPLPPAMLGSGSANHETSDSPAFSLSASADDHGGAGHVAGSPLPAGSGGGNGAGSARSSPFTTPSASFSSTDNKRPSPTSPHTSAGPSLAPSPSPAPANANANASLTPHLLHPFHNRVVAIAAGFSHSVAVTAAGAVFTWGCGTYGRLGHGAHCDEFLPRQVLALSMGGVFVVSAAAGSAHTLFLSDGGLVFGCGLDSKGQVGGVTFEGESDKDKDKDKANKYDRHAVLCPRPIEIPPVPPTHRGPGADTSSPRHSTLLTPTATSSSSSASSAAATKGGVDTTVRGSVGTVLVSQISCGDFHSAAITQSQRLYVWGACQLDSGAAPARSGAGKVGDKVDVTPILGGVPKKVGCSAGFTLVTIA